MKKNIILLVFCLAITLSILLKWQWHAYTSSSSEKNLIDADQKIQIVSEEKVLKIKQTFSGLESEKELEIIVPSDVHEWICESSSGEPCSSNDQNPNTFLPVNGIIQFVYSIPIDRENSFSMLSDWKIRLKDVNIQYSTVSIAETSHRKGIWVTSLPIRGYDRLELIDFFSFSGEGDFNSLYFQNQSFNNHNQITNLTYYADDKDNKKGLNFPLYSQLPKKSFLAIVFTNNMSKSSSDIMFFKPNQSLKVVENRLISHFFQSKLENNLDWVAEVLVSTYMKEIPKGEKAASIYYKLTNVLSSEELEKFMNMITNSSEKLNEQKLDLMLGKAKGLETRFFQNNISKIQLEPLYFFETKMIKLNNGPPSKEELIYINGKILYSVDTVLTKLGYRVEKKSEQLFINNDSHSYQFYSNQNLFNHNGQEYGLLENPLVLLNHEFYMEKKWLQTLFKLTIEENEEMLSRKKLYN